MMNATKESVRKALSDLVDLKHLARDNRTVGLIDGIQLVLEACLKVLPTETELAEINKKKPEDSVQEVARRGFGIELP